MMTSNKEFLLQRISIFLGKTIDPNSDDQVEEVLRSKFNIRLPQRRSMDDSLSASISDHEIIALLLKYRSMKDE